MADHISITTPSQGSPSRISWGSVFAGVVVATAVMFTLCELCMAFGLSLLKPQDPSKDSAISSIAMGGAIAWVVSAMIATFAGAWAASHLARQRTEADSVLHGLLVWGLGIVAMVTLGATAAGVLVGGAFSLVGSGMNAAGSAIGGAAHGAGAAMSGVAQGAGSLLGQRTEGTQGAGMAPAFNWDSIKFKAQSLLRQGTNGAMGGSQNQNPGQNQNQNTGNQANNGTQNQNQAPGAQSPAPGVNDQAANANAQPAGGQDANRQGNRAGGSANASGSGNPEEAMALVSRVFSNPSGTVSESDRAALVSMLTANTSLSQAEATQQVQQWEQAAQRAREQYESLKAEAEQKARAAAATAAKTLADAAWLAFVATVLAASAAMLGAHFGGPRETMVGGTSVREIGGHPGGAAVPT